MTEVRAGAQLPPLEIPITRTLIVAGAIASRDYQDVHHDPELARRRGSPDVFMNILTTNGLVGRYITDHFGPTAVLRKVAIRLGAPNYPGDTMVLSGTVEEVDGATATVRVVGENGMGRHVTGTVTVTVPPERSAGGALEGTAGGALEGTAAGAPGRSAGGASEGTAAGAPGRSVSGPPERTVGSAPERTVGSAPERTVGSPPERTVGSAPERAA